MCGRFTLKTSASELQAELDLVIPAVEMRPRYNISPSQRIAGVKNDGARQLEFFRWGLIPSWAKDASIGNRMINARAESLPEKPSFRTPLKKRRCIILADGFYEWHTEGKTKTPLYIRLASQKPFVFAGLWETWRSPDGQVVPSCTIITTTPNAFMARFHDRMPVILPREKIDEWLSPEPKEAAELMPLLVPWEGEPLEAYPVSSLVNSPANEKPECIEPAA